MPKAIQKSCLCDASGVLLMYVDVHYIYKTNKFDFINVKYIAHLVMCDEAISIENHNILNYI